MGDRCESSGPLIAAIHADVIGSRRLAHPERTLPRLEQGARTLNARFAEAIACPFGTAAGDELRGALRDPAQAPFCVTAMREELAPIQVRVGVGIGPALAEGDERAEPSELARTAIATAKQQGGVIRYLGTGVASDTLLGALCRLADPLLVQRTVEQWQTVAAYRRLGTQREVARALKISRQSVSARLLAAHWSELEEADTAIAAYFASLRDRQG